MSQRKENKTPEKRTKQNGDQQATRCRVQNTGSKELSEPSEDLSSMKKDQSEVKDTLTEMNSLQGINRVGEAENQISNLELRKSA